MALAHQCMQALITNLNALFDAAPKSNLPKKAAAENCFGELLRRLRGWVAECDTAAVDAIEPARDASPNPDDPAWLELERALARYDFTAAAVSLERLAERLEGTWKGETDA
jgi:hypothetical protein